MTRAKHPDPGSASSEARHHTRQAALIDHLQRMQNQTGTSLADFAQALAEAYGELVPPWLRGLSITPAPAGDTAEDYFHWKQSLEKAVQRFVDGSVRMPVEIEEAWLWALPSPYRERCRHDLCVRMGVLPVEIPDDETTAEHMGDLLEAAGAEASAAGPVFRDGRMTEADAEHLPAVVRACEESAAKSLSIAARARRILRRLGRGDGSHLEAVR